MENYKLFDSYLSGEMSPEEKSGFEKMLENDKDFARDFALYKELDDLVLLAIKREEFRNNLLLAEKEAQVFQKKKSGLSLLFRNKWLVAAASVLLVAVLSVSLYNVFFARPDFSRLYAENYQPLDVSFITRSAEADTGIFHHALTLYQHQKYNECIRELNVMQVPGDLIPVRNTFLGLSYLATDDLKNAEYYLQLAAQDSLHIMYDDCLWFLSLTHLKAKNSDECKKYLELLIKNESVYKQKAEELLEEL